MVGTLEEPFQNTPSLGCLGNNSSCSTMVDIGVKSAWVCQTEGHQLADILLPVHLSNRADDEEDLSHSDKKTDEVAPVLLEQVEEGSPCVLTVSCRTASSVAISSLMVVSEARTMEVYNQLEEYCGTVRGLKDESIQSVSPERGPFYRKQLVLDYPSSACEVKLLSLAGRSSILIRRVVLRLQELQPAPTRGPGIDLQQVQNLVEEMGTSLSPGAQNLLDMVQFQQKNQTGSLGGFLPLLMGGGGFSALAGGVRMSAATARSPLHPADATPPEPIRSADLTPSHNGGMSEGSTSPDLSISDISSNNTASSDNGEPVNHTQVEEIMSHFLKGRSHGQALSPELLPMLQSVCGQVTKLRLDNTAAALEREKKMRNGTCELDPVMERRLEDMERRLKEHMDRRLDALEQKLEKALLMAALNHGAVSGPPGRAAPIGPSDHSHPTPAAD
ncbi:ATPase PAAT isoform X1 [Gambusia affinis]|uniref:ATPase PAAT isoform X1 n=2 Tax=Gambusia affinis TaxID=33528 RepID=UPI001CDC3091|nr:ATPase PAAT isoform X1 [Gambusia affinis]